MQRNRKYIPTGRPVGRPRKTVSETISRNLKQEVANAVIKYAARKKGLPSGISEEVAYFLSSPAFASLLFGGILKVVISSTKKFGKTPTGERVLETALGRKFKRILEKDEPPKVEEVLDDVETEEEDEDFEELLKAYLKQKMGKKKNPPILFINLIKLLVRSRRVQFSILWAFAQLLKNEKFKRFFVSEIAKMAKEFTEDHKGEVVEMKKSRKGRYEGKKPFWKVFSNPPKLPEIYTRITCLEINEPGKKAFRVEVKGKAKVYGCEDGSLLLLGEGLRGWEWDGCKLCAIEAVKGAKSNWKHEAFRHDFSSKPTIKILKNGALHVKGKKMLHKNFSYPDNF